MDNFTDTRSALEAINATVAEFKNSHTQQIAELKARGFSDPVLNDKVDRIAGTLAALEEKQARQALANRRAPRGGETAYDPLSDAHSKAFNAFIRKGQDSELIALERSQSFAPGRKAMTVGSDPEGGYTVPHELSARIATRLRDFTPIRQLANIIEISSDALEMISDRNEAEAAWVAETAARNETSTPLLGKVRIPVHEIAAQPKVSQKLLDDSSINIEEYIGQKVADRFARREADAFVNGDGIVRPRGFLTATTSTNNDDTRTWGQLQYIASGAAGAFASSSPADKLLDMVYSLKAAHLARAVWLMPRSVSAAIRKLKGGDGNYLWQTSLQTGQPPTLLGFPVFFAEDMPAMAANSLSLAFGDFQEGYTIVDRIGIRMLRDPYTDKPNVKFYTTKRVGGDIVNFDAIKLMKFATT
jgi:HK97 family phage major capsid protein